jgi:starch synthase
MHIIHVATELAPVAKVGGLGDVLYGLSKALVKKGHKVDVLLPKYDSIDYTQLKQLKVEMREVLCTEGTNQINNSIWSCELENLRLLLLEPHHPQYYFSRGRIYGSPDDIERFNYFCRASLEYLLKAKISPDVLHLHDWPTALMAPLYKEVYSSMGLKVGGTVLTIHNLEHQGKCLPAQIARVGLRGENPLIREKMQDPQSPNLINLMRGGIEYADFITTVSPTYEKEIQTKNEGMGLDEVLKKQKKKMRGIINGIDEHFWNPEKDPLLVKRYPTHQISSREMLAKVLEAKAENRKHVRTHFGLRDENKPLVASITRLVSQKGPELIFHAMQFTLQNEAQFVLLGSDHGSQIEKAFLPWHGKDERVGICIDRDEALAHLIFAAADMLIISSRFEPCGLTQLISLRYGTVPIARRTGGLADTVFDIETSDRKAEERNGFTFDHFDTHAVEWALGRALTCWANDRAKWEKIMMNGMRMDFSWENSAALYLEIYAPFARKKEKAA